MQRTQNVRGAAEQRLARSRKTERQLHLVQSEITFSFLRQGRSDVSVNVQDMLRRIHRGKLESDSNKNRRAP